MASHFLSIIIAFIILPHLVSADCECGYSINDTSKDRRSALFTTLWETDFLHLSSVNPAVGWQPQAYNVSAEESRGPFGKIALVDNVIPNPLKDPGIWNGAAVNGGDPGLQLWVRSELVKSGSDNTADRLIPAAEIDSMRNDMMYGSFRAGIKYTGVNGTCGAWFWYRNNSQEIDVELLSRQFSSDNSSINLVLQSPKSLKQGYNAAGTDSFYTPSMPMNPSDGFHEYRYDWLPDRVEFYLDGQLLRTMFTSLPDGPGKLMLNHWSNGDPAWSGGPPRQDAVMTIMYLKTYFNASNTNSHYREQCPIYDPAKVCHIPDQKVAPRLTKDQPPTFFFSLQNSKVPEQNENITNATWDAHGQHNAATSRTAYSAAACWTVGLLSIGVALFEFIM